MWANAWLQLDFAYADYLLPLGIGLCVGGLCVMVGRKVFRPRLEALPPPKPREFYDPFTHGSPNELRRTPRRGGNPVEVFYARPEDKRDPRRAWVVDRSIGGLGMHLTEEIAAGTILAVLPVNASEMTPWMDVEVVQCKKIDAAWEVGCKFVKTPPSLILMQFG